MKSTLLSIIWAASVAAEYVPEQLEWSSTACQEAGLDGDFDVCATLEFCEGTGTFGANDGDGRKTMGHHVRRELQGAYGYGNYYVGGSGGETMGYTGGYGGDNSGYGYGGGSGQDSSTPSEGTFGWRLSGSTSCSSPGPIIRLDRNIRYGLLVHNTASSDSTNLHTHGLHISGTGNADDVTREILPGDTSIYNLTLPTNHMGGTYWYHSHYHPRVKAHVAGGAFGMLIVEDDVEHLGTTDPNVLDFMKNERFLVLDNCRKLDQTTVNGLYDPSEGTKFDINADEWYRFRLLNVQVDSHTSGSYVEFDGTNCEARAVAYDGILKFQVPGEPQTKFFLTSSSRLDLAVKCSSTTSLRANGRSLATLRVTDSPSAEAKPDATPLENDQTPWSSERPVYLQDLSSSNVDNQWTIDVYETSINDIQFSLDKPLCASDGDDFSYGTVQEWTLKGTVGHPFHVHVFPMQVIGDCGDEHEVGEFYDTVVVQTNDYTGNARKCRVRLHLIQLTGHVMMHCHILQHSDQGAMGYINVVARDSVDTSDLLVQPLEPRVLTCASGDNCDAPPELTHCVKRMPMVHSSPGDSMPPMDMPEVDVPMDMEMEMPETVDDAPTESEPVVEPETFDEIPVLDPTEDTEDPVDESYYVDENDPLDEIYYEDENEFADEGLMEPENHDELPVTDPDTDPVMDPQLDEDEFEFVPSDTSDVDYERDEDEAEAEVEAEQSAMEQESEYYAGGIESMVIQQPEDESYYEGEGSVIDVTVYGLTDEDEDEYSYNEEILGAPPSLSDVGLEFKEDEYKAEYSVSDLGGPFDTKAEAVNAYWSSKASSASRRQVLAGAGMMLPLLFWMLW